MNMYHICRYSTLKPRLSLPSFQTTNIPVTRVIAHAQVCGEVNSLFSLVSPNIFKTTTAYEEDDDDDGKPNGTSNIFLLQDSVTLTLLLLDFSTQLRWAA